MKHDISVILSVEAESIYDAIDFVLDVSINHFDDQFEGISTGSQFGTPDMDRIAAIRDKLEIHAQRHGVHGFAVVDAPANSAVIPFIIDEEGVLDTVEGFLSKAQEPPEAPL